MTETTTKTWKGAVTHPLAATASRPYCAAKAMKAMLGGMLMSVVVSVSRTRPIATSVWIAQRCGDEPEQPARRDAHQMRHLRPLRTKEQLDDRIGEQHQTDQRRPLDRRHVSQPEQIWLPYRTATADMLGQRRQQDRIQGADDKAIRQLADDPSPVV